MERKVVKENLHGNKMPKDKKQQFCWILQQKKKSGLKKFLLVSVWLCQHRSMIQ